MIVVEYINPHKTYWTYNTYDMGEATRREWQRIGPVHTISGLTDYFALFKHETGDEHYIGTDQIGNIIERIRVWKHMRMKENY